MAKVNKIKKQISRREFLKATTVASAFVIVPRHVLGGPAHRPPSEKLNIAGIGVGGMGGSNLRQCESENIVALCDVDSNYAAKTFKRYPKAKVHKDYRVMFEKQKDFDAVVIATPDHTHAVITMAAIEAGKHVYCQKPLTHTVYEARKVTEAARKYKVQTQMGNQGHSSEQIRLLKEWLADGSIGNVTQVYAWTDRPVGGDPWSDFAVRARPTDTPAVPESLDWDLYQAAVLFLLAIKGVYCTAHMVPVDCESFLKRKCADTKGLKRQYRESITAMKATGCVRAKKADRQARILSTVGH